MDNNTILLPAQCAVISADEMTYLDGGADDFFSLVIENMKNTILGMFKQSVSSSITIGWNGTGIANGLENRFKDGDNLAALLFAWMIKPVSVSFKINLTPILK